MGELKPDDEKMRKRAEALMGDFIYEREELREGPRFHIPPFVERKIEGTKTIFYMPVDAEEVTDAGTAPPAPVEPAAAGSPMPSMTVRPEPAALPQPPAAAARQPQPAAPEPLTPIKEQAATSPPPPAGPPKQAPYEFPAKMTMEPSRPVSFRKPYMKPDTYGSRRPSLQPLQRRPSAKDLIARLRVVKEGVETREQVLQRTAEATAPVEPAEPAEGEPELETEAAPQPEAAPPAAEVPPREARLAPAPSPTPQKELEQKTEGGKLCPSCGSPISDRNRLLICSSCGKVSCDNCGRYELAHLKTDIYYDYKFDFPLCLQCYGNAFSIQRLLGRASVCYGNGNYTYALYYANQALEQDPESRYAPKARDLVSKINKAHEQAHERDQQWRLQRKQFVSRNRQEDPSWR